jgi:hypothetical protein
MRFPRRALRRGDRRTREETRREKDRYLREKETKKEKIIFSMTLQKILTYLFVAISLIFEGFFGIVTLVGFV